MKTLLTFFFLMLLSTGFCQQELNNSQKMALQSMHFTSQGQELDMAYVYERSARPNGSTVLLLHGKNFSNVYWANTISYLSEKGYDVVAPDQVGFGRSSMPAGYQHSFQQMAANTKKLVDTLKITSLVVLGHSMGGMLATRFCLMYPALCTRLILENPIGLEDWKIQVPYSTIDEEYKKELKKTRDDLKQYMLKNYFHHEWKEDYEKLLDETARFINTSGFPAYARSMALTSDMIFTQPVCYEFKDLKLPVVLIIGQEDRTAIGKEKAPNALLGNYPALGKQTAALIPKCQLIELKDLGHIPHIEDFKQFTNALKDALKD